MGTVMRIAGMAGKKFKCYGVSLPRFFKPPRPPRVPRPPPPKPEPFPEKVGHFYRERNIGEEIRVARKEDRLCAEEEGRPPPIAIPSGGFLPLWDLRDNPGSHKKQRRVGRGIGSGRGKTCGRGHKGQRARGHKPRLGFEGGQTPLRLRLPRKYIGNPFAPVFQRVQLTRLKVYIEKGKIDPSKLITMKTMRDVGLSSKHLRDGVLLTARRAANTFDIPVHLEVSRVTVAARKAIEEAGGTVRRVHYNKLGLKALCDPDWFIKKKRRLLPQPARPKPKVRKYVDDIGRLPAPDTPILPEGFKLRAPVHGHPSPEDNPPPEGNPPPEDSDSTKA